MIKRIKQLYRAVMADLSETDRAFLKKYLSVQETVLFYKMNVYDQRHVINVAYSAEKLAKKEKLDKNLLLRAALLHDIGRSADLICLGDKILFVLLEALPAAFLKAAAKNGGYGFVGRRRNALYICLNHAEIGARKLEQIGKTELAQIVRKHHDKPSKDDSEELIFLRLADEIN